MPAAPRRFPTTIPTAARAAAVGIVVAALAGCVAEGGVDAARRAARADSAAAGYAIAADSSDRARDASAAALLARVRRALGIGPREDTSRVTVVAVAPVVHDPPRAAQVEDVAPRRTGPSSADAVAADTAAATHGTRPMQTTHAADADSAARPSPDSLVRQGAFLAWNPARRTVQLEVVAGYDGVNASLNFNGGAHGERAVVVPRDWYVEVRFRQGDEALAHSALVAPLVTPILVDAPPPAFPYAATSRASEGLIEGGTDGFAFVADRAGDFVLQCGVPGHAQSGMWIRFVVDSMAAAPRYR
ncbi:MAG TPA: sulfocyanin-like copper-binding protein [Gemmatimonadaceae bacterium]